MTRYADARLTALKKAVQEAGEVHKVPASTMLTQYAIERFLRRVSLMENNNKREIVLRGGVLLAMWHPQDGRPSTTVDLLCRRSMDDAALQTWLQSVCTAEDPDDGLAYQPDSILLTDKRSAGGFRSRHASIGVLLGRQRTQLNVQVAYQKDIIPQPHEDTLAPLLSLEMAPVKIWTCVKETVLAEKLHMVHALGRQPSYKDLYDMYLLVQLHPYVGGPMMTAIKSAFEQNISTIAEHLPQALSLTGGSDAILNAGWGAFIRQMGTPMHGKPWADTIGTLHNFFAPPWDHLVRQKPFPSTWLPSTGWHYQSS